MDYSATREGEHALTDPTRGAPVDVAGVTLTDPTGTPCPLHRSDRPTLVAVATLETGERAFELGLAVRKAVDSDRLAITLVADLSGMPRLARAVLRQQLEDVREDIADWLADNAPPDDGADPWAALALLADWDGSVTGRLGFDRRTGEPLFLVAAPDGAVLACAVPDDADDLVSMVRSALGTAA
jgi:hypothetical protein